MGDIGKAVFLSSTTAGGLSLTPAQNTGNLIQRIGYIKDVTSSYVEIEIHFGPEIIA